MRFLMRLIVTALATAVAVWLVPGIHLGSENRVVTLLLVALIFGLVNAIIKPIVTVVSTCLVVLTLGLFMLVINAGMLMLTSWLAGNLGLGFHVAGFWPALLGSLIISIVGAILGGLLGSNHEDSAA